MEAADLLDLLGGDPTTAKGMANAMSKRAQGAQGAGLVLRTLTGDRDPTGGAFIQQGQHDQDLLAKAIEQRPEYQAENVKAQQAGRQWGQAQNPDSFASQASRQLAQKFGLTIPEGASAADIEPVLPEAGKAYGAQALNDYRSRSLGLKGSEVMTTHDAYGNPVVIQKHGGTAPPGQLVQPGSGASPKLLSAGAGPLTGPALDQAADQFYRTGKLQGGMGKGAAITNALIRNRTAELHPDADLSGNAAGYKADTGSLAKQQSLLDSTESWESTGKANLDNMLAVAKTLTDTGSPWLNRPVREFVEKGAGDPNQTAFKAAHAAVVNEYAKILSGSQGSGAVTEGAHKEAESMLPLDATWDQLKAAANILNQDAGNRVSSIRNQVQSVRTRTGGKAAPVAAVPIIPAAPDHAGAKAWAEAHPSDPRAAKILEQLKAIP